MERRVWVLRVECRGSEVEEVRSRKRVEEVRLQLDSAGVIVPTIHEQVKLLGTLMLASVEGGRGLPLSSWGKNSRLSPRRLSMFIPLTSAWYNCRMIQVSLLSATYFQRKRRVKNKMAGAAGMSL